MCANERKLADEKIEYNILQFASIFGGQSFFTPKHHNCNRVGGKIPPKNVNMPHLY